MTDRATPPVFLAPTEAIRLAAPGQIVEITGDEARHALAARRLRPGEPVELVDGLGAFVTGSVVEGAPNREGVGAAGTALVGQPAERDAERTRRRAPGRRDTGTATLQVSVEAAGVVAAPEPQVWVVQALAKGDRAEQAVESLTEVGVDVIIPWSASRSVVQWHGERGAKALQRWRRVAAEAGKQSRRRIFPEVRDLHSTAAVADLLAGAGTSPGPSVEAGSGAGYVLHEHADDPFVPSASRVNGPVVLIVGPEGGVTDAELVAFASAGAKPVRLGPTVMRTSTAGTAAAAVALSALGRWG